MLALELQDLGCRDALRRVAIGAVQRGVAFLQTVPQRVVVNLGRVEADDREVAAEVIFMTVGTVAIRDTAM